VPPSADSVKSPVTSASTPIEGTRRAATAGVGFMLLGIFLFCCNDALGKWILATYSVGQMLLIRSLAALVLLAPFIWHAGREAFTSAPRPGLQILRLLLASTEVVMFFWAVSYLPLADAVTFYLAGPIYVTALSATLLGERVGWRRWTAVIVGFVGVLIALQPSPATLTWPALIALTGSFCYALLMIVTRYVRGTHDVVMAAGQISTTLVFSVIAAPLSWQPLPLTDALLMALLGLVSVIALMCVNRSLKLAPFVAVTSASDSNTLPVTFVPGAWSYSRTPALESSELPVQAPMWLRWLPFLVLPPTTPPAPNPIWIRFWAVRSWVPEPTTVLPVILAVFCSPLTVIPFLSKDEITLPEMLLVTGGAPSSSNARL
jgi:drug/metabolite transporter (DMT)-like permease